MMHKRKYFTFLYVPVENSRLKTIRIPRWMAYGFAVALGVLLLATVVAVLKYSGGVSDGVRLARLERENQALRSQLSGFQSDLGDLDRFVQQNFDFQKKARILANLDDLSEDVAEVGVGGPDAGYVQSLSLLDDDTRGTVSTLRDDLDKLLRQAKLQSDSYEDIIAHLSEDQKRLGATPSIQPLVRGYISSRFGPRMDPITGRASRHYGVDYSARLGTPILATADGIVTFAGKWASFGSTVEISHGFDYVTRYAHCSKLMVKKGQKVKRGDIIARVGSSGRATATHLHYEVIHEGKKENPLAYVLTGKEVFD